MIITNIAIDTIVAIVVLAIAANVIAAVIVVVAYSIILAVSICGILQSFLFAGPFCFTSLVAGVCVTLNRHCIFIYNFRSIGNIINNVFMGIIVSCVRS